VKSLFLNIIFFIICSKVFGQNDYALSIIEDAIRSRQKVNYIVYLDSSINYHQSISDFVKKRKIHGYKDTTKVILELSKKEIEYLDQGFKNTKKNLWRENMFENSLRINQDSIKIFSDSTKGHLYFRKNFGEKYFLFSPPVFFRNNTLAVFRLCELYYPVAGYDLLYFYEKRNEKWGQILLIHAGAW
jgi:hypothetical protein